jgi:FMN-dependent oxidoreductase (nitrilotriacetate monooxygenase family)
MSDPSSHLHLCAFPHSGPLAWRQPGASAESDMNLGLYCDLARTAERGLFDALFLADNVAINEWHAGIEASDRIGNGVVFEPFTLLSALAMVTDHIGLMATASTTYNEPYHVARKFASLDHISGGRAGWNVVTSRTESEAANFGLDSELDADGRYERAEEFVDVVNKLWDGWADDAFIRDRVSGAYYDKARMRVPNHVGRHFTVKGPLNIPRPPQGRPVLCQAGRSEAGMELAARTGDLIFNNQHSADASRRFRTDIRARAARHGRQPGDIRFMAGLFVVVGGTEEEAQRKMRDARDAVDMPTAKRFLAQFLPSIEVQGLEDDAPPPDIASVREDAARAGMQLVENGKRLSVRELCTSYGNHWRQIQKVGAVEQVADLMEDWLKQEAADGFNLMTLSLPGGYTDFVDGVVPELQQRGIYRTAYEGKTLRENLGIARPDAGF